MADVRALLKAKRQEVRINHPLASYSGSGQLRCIACGIIIKEGTAWNGHIGSKAHRMNAARLREEERQQELRRETELQQQKRSMDEVDADTSDEELQPKRRRVEDAEGSPSAGAPPLAPNGEPRSAFPADFFSDASRAPPPPSSDDGSEDIEVGGPPAPRSTSAAATAIDKEWEEFQAALIEVPDAREAYKRATVFAEPVLVSEIPEGFPPPSGQADGAGEQKDPSDEAAVRRRKEQEERELIMDRLMDEEQAQEEADAKVVVLKNKLDALKKHREAARAAKRQKGSR
ncbi:uncharacterized protein FIBRA_06888 [Fibroporia radiculosa]|uniref:Uncharacterized protein n=1 Tax=Fibroporia radiculosa TaxID=599839 RepID=J4HZT7_9APHY|nr:uncharacterized protein FIBRA_06888 [Fibroporia radiculosa]CCM04702.1 predicted protein [Fibroporia radiculosa]